MTLTEFLLARIAEDEGRIRSEAVEHARYYYPDEERSAPNWFAAEVESYLTLDGARALRECEAKRRLVDIHKAWQYPDSPALYCERCSGAGEFSDLWPCETLKILAAIYADHPDYDPAWASA